MAKLLKELVILAASGFTVIALLVLAIWGVSALFFSSEPERAEDVLTARATATPSMAASSGGGDDRASTPTPTATLAPTSTPQPAPTQAPAPAPPVAPVAPPAPPPAAPAPSATADFSGRWRIVDTITAGQGTGQTYSFDVALSQSGNQLSGGNS